MKIMNKILLMILHNILKILITKKIHNKDNNNVNLNKKQN